MTEMEIELEKFGYLTCNNLERAASLHNMQIVLSINPNLVYNKGTFYSHPTLAVSAVRYVQHEKMHAAVCTTPRAPFS